MAGQQCASFDGVTAENTAKQLLSVHRCLSFQVQLVCGQLPKCLLMMLESRWTYVTAGTGVKI